ncbi:MAG: hypothetical protein IPP32_01290 [Bacteroidetes bacterium]|nr:hypothetical protein [Bacteroidota bacterium]
MSASVETQSPYIWLIKIVITNRKSILIFVSSIVVIAILASTPYFIPPQYKSEVIFYPPNTSSNKILIQNDVRFGSDKEIDQHIQLLKSSLVRDSVIKKFQLILHYNIDTLEKDWAFQLNEEYDENITIARTRYNALAVSVIDTDPKLAARIANDMVNIADGIKATILRKNLQAALKDLELDYNKKVKEFDVFADNINKLVRDRNIPNLNIKNQSFVEHMKQQIDLIRDLTKNPVNYDLKKQYNYESMLAQLAELQSSYEQASSNLNNNFPTCYVISPAQVNFKKEAPNRLLIIFLSGVSAVLLSLLCIVVAHKLKQLKHDLEK